MDQPANPQPSAAAKKLGLPVLPADTLNEDLKARLDGRYYPTLAAALLGEAPALDVREVVKEDPTRLPHYGIQIDAVVMFVDISSFTKRTKEIEPGQTAFFVNGYFKTIWPDFEGARAVLDKVIGDEIMVVLSTRLGCEKPRETAFRLAKHLLRWDEEGMRPHVGYAFGPVWLGFAGPPAAMLPTVFGTTVNLAARLAHATPPSALAITDDEWNFVKTLVTLHDPDEKPDHSRFSLKEPEKSLKDFDDVKFHIIQRNGGWFPQRQFPPITIGRVITEAEYEKEMTEAESKKKPAP